MTKVIQKKDLSDLDLESLGDGFAIVAEGNVPVAAIANFGYYKYINWLINQVKDYVEKTKQDQQDDVGDSKDR